MELRPDSETTGSHRVGWEEVEFEVLPRVGDTITANSNADGESFEKGHLYEVVRVVMSKEGQPKPSDVFVVHQGTIFDGYDEEKRIANEKFVPFDDQ
jgi:hypothetical protein